MSRPEIVLIAAVAEKNRIIGKDGKLPWYISEDLRRFKRLTLGHAVLMGRKTFESILQRLSQPLPERRNVVLTSHKSFPDYPEVETYSSFEVAIEALTDEPVVFVIGGETVFKETLGLADRLELTIVEGDYKGDAFFPEYEHLIGERFKLVAKEQGEGYRFETFKRAI
ncbi:MAG: dihydrofolate reductase [bacterium]